MVDRIDFQQLKAGEVNLGVCILLAELYYTLICYF